MATSPDRSYVEQLREMRSTRMQQLRQGGQQATLLSKQINVLSNLDKTMNSVLRAQNSSIAALRDMNSKQGNISRQNEQMSKSINNLASSVTRSMGGMASAIGRGAGGAASAAGSAGGAIAGAASSVASGVASALAKALPFAIAGVVGKMLVWDNIEDSTKKELSQSFGGMIKGVIGDLNTSEISKALKPIASELGDVFGALGDTLEGVSNRISSMVKKIPASIEKAREGIEKANEGIERVGGAIKNPPAEARAAMKMANQVGGAIKDVATGTSLPEYETAKTRAAVVGGVAAVGGAIAVGRKVARGKAGPTTAPTPAAAAVSSPPANSQMYKPNKFAGWMETPANKEAMKELSKRGEKVTKVALVGARIFIKLVAAGGKYLAELVKLVAKTKLGGFMGWASILVQSGAWWYTQAVIDEMAPEPKGDGTLTEEEYKALTEQAKKSALYSGTGGVVGASLGTGAGLAMGPLAPVAAPVLGFLGGIAGSMLGEKAAAYTTKLPESLTKEAGVSENRSALGNAGGARDAREARKQKPVKPQGAISPTSAGSSSSAFDMFKGAIGGAESRGDYNARNKSGSSASGKYQVIKDTFERMAKRKDSPVYGMTWEEYRNSGPKVQEDLMDYMLQYYSQVLTAGKVPINEQTLYLAHFLGAETAVKVYNSDPNDPLSKYIKKDGLYDLMIKQNPGLVTEGTTTGGIQLELGKRVSSKMAGGKPSSKSSLVASSSTAPSASVSSSGSTPITSVASNDSAPVASVASSDSIPSASVTSSESGPSTSFDENLARRRAMRSSGGELEKDKEVVAQEALAAANMKAEAEEKKEKQSRMAKLQESMGLNIFGELSKVLGPMTQDLQKGYEENFAMQNTSSEPSVSSSDNSTTVVNVAGGGGGGGTTVNSVTPSHNYNQQFNSLAGGQRA